MDELIIDDRHWSGAALPKGWHQIRDRLLAWRYQGGNSFFGLPFTRDELNTSLFWSRQIREQARALTVFGIGGSSLGGEMLVAALAADGLPVHFVSNLDPDHLAPVALTDWRDHFLLVISKSGETLETISQFLTTLPDLQSLWGAKLHRHVAFLTSRPESTLGQIATALNCPLLPHPGVGGRYSALSTVGLLPAAVAGASIHDLLAGAARMAERCLAPQGHPVWHMAAAAAHAAAQGRSTTVTFTYGQRFHRLSAWYGQLCAESLGKRDPQDLPRGLTPLAAVGVTDQHSLLQLFLDGPPDKQFTFILDRDAPRQGRPLPDRFRELPLVAALAGHTTGSLFQAEQLAVQAALVHTGAPVRCFSLPARSAFALGELLLLLQVETVLLAEQFGIDPFNQPGVERCKAGIALSRLA